MMRKATCVLALACLLVPSGAMALGLGNIEVDSALNEPLSARIELRAVQTGDLEEMQVSLGTTEQFARAGVERPFLLSRLRFDVRETPGGGAIEVTTRDPIAEPFLNFLIEVNWPRGRIIREYTVLLDPPVYGAAISTTAQETVATVEALPQADKPSPEPAPAPTFTIVRASPSAVRILSAKRGSCRRYRPYPCPMRSYRGPTAGR